MAEQVQELINKIKKEGLQEVEAKGRQIEDEARKRADELVKQAKEEAARLVEQGKNEIRQNQEAARASLQQAARDVILNLHKEINNVLRAVVMREVRQSLSGKDLTAILEQAIKTYMQQNKDITDIKLLVSEADLEHLKHGLLAKLQERLKGSISLRSEQDIGAGFVISFNADKTSFEFTDQSLVQYLGDFLNEEVSAIIQSTIKKEE